MALAVNTNEALDKDDVEGHALAVNQNETGVEERDALAANTNEDEVADDDGD